MKKLLLLTCLFLGAYAASRYAYPRLLLKYFSISGEILLSKGAPRKIKPNWMLFVVAKNKGGIPVAMQKIINPGFPQKFHLSSSAILMPDLLSSRLRLEAYLSKDGIIGKRENAEIAGFIEDPVFINSRGVTITLSKNTGRIGLKSY